MNKKAKNVASARAKADSEQKDENMQVSQHNAKTNVVCSQSPLILVIDGLEVFKGVKTDYVVNELKTKAISQGLE